MPTVALATRVHGSPIEPGAKRLNYPLVDIGVNLTSKQFAADQAEVIERALAASVPRDAQREAFMAQLDIAAELGKPVFLHQRAAHGDFLRILSQAWLKLSGGVVHCFTGGERELAAYLELGLHIGITGFVCDERRGTHLQRLVSCIPSDRLLIETDAPFLLPRDLKSGSRRNEPRHLAHLARRLAEFVGKDEATLRRENDGECVPIVSVGYALRRSVSWQSAADCTQTGFMVACAIRAGESGAAPSACAAQGCALRADARLDAACGARRCVDSDANGWRRVSARG